eukprot:7294466-Prymnesium_polylepis.1
MSNATRCEHVSIGSRESAAAVVAAWAHATPHSGRADIAFADSAGQFAFLPTPKFGFNAPVWVARSFYLPDCTGVLCESTCPTTFDADTSASNNAWLTPTLET